MVFKLLALRLNSSFPLQKNLKEKQFYKFSNDFRFLDQKGKELERADSYDQVVKIEDRQTYPATLYDLHYQLPAPPWTSAIHQDQPLKKTLHLNMTAVVGQNGSGKSSLLEIFYLFLFCISESKDFINHKAGIERAFRDPKEQGMRDLLENNRKILLKSTDMELYYRIGERHYLVKRSQGNTLKYGLTNGEWLKEKWEESDFFYTIGVNYSQYGLNAQWDYYWLKPLFHKNDGYKTPLVLNPFRDNGNIDINRETHLAQIRLLTNLSHEQFASTTLIDDKSIDFVTFFIRPARNGVINGIGENGNQSVPLTTLANAPLKGKNALTEKSTLIAFFEKLLERFDPTYKNHKHYERLITNVQSYLEGKKLDPGLIPKEAVPSADLSPNAVRFQLALYILIKAVKICNKYPGEFIPVTEEVKVKVRNTTIALRAIKSAHGAARRLFFNQSHVTLKLHQAVNVLVSDNLWYNEWESFPDDQAFGNIAFRAHVPFQEVRSGIQRAYSKAGYAHKQLAQFVPGAFFTPALTITGLAGKFPFQQMSSGEQQLIHSVHSVLYHLLNLDSIHWRKGPGGTKMPEQYAYVNVILDEIELYYHPQYQRQFVQFLRENIEKIRLRFIEGINILFSTHSPFILSDIPGVNVLRLEKGEPARFNQQETFGANIHDMLADAFFMGDGLIGQFAETKVDECIAYINEISLLRDIFHRTSDYAVQRKRAFEPVYAVTEAKSRLAELKPKRGYQSYEEAVQEELETKYIFERIQLIGEEVMKFKLMEMYHAALLTESSEEESVRQLVMKMIRENNLKLDDLF